MVVVATPGGAPAVTDGDNGRIAFEREAGGSSDIYVVGRPGTELESPVNVTDPSMAASREADPTWAPPTSFPALAFESDLDGDIEIYTHEIDEGVEPVPFTSNTVDDTDPAWAPSEPDGSPFAAERPPIAFVRDVGGTGDVFVRSFDGGVETNVTDSAADEANPDWSPDGRHLAFETSRAGTREIWVMRIRYVSGAPGEYEASNLRPVTPRQPPSFSPSWFSYRQIPGDTPPNDGDGEGPSDPPPGTGPCVDDTSGDPPECIDAPAERIAFAGPDADGNMEIFFASYEGDDPEQVYVDPGLIATWELMDTGAQEASPVWSPHGDVLLFQSDAAGAERIHIMDQDGENEEPLRIATDPAAADRNPAWEALPESADVDTRRPCGRFSNRRRCRRAARVASVVGCPADPGACPLDNRPVPETRRPVIDPPGPAAGGCDLRGDSNGNVLRGTPAADVICGGGGEDVLVGGGGGDVLRGGGGRDRLVGGRGRDRLYGQAGADRLSGGAERDLLRGGPGGDVLDGGPATDVMLGGAGSDLFAGRDRRRDRIVGGGGQDTAVVDPRRDLIGGVERLRRPA